MFIDVDTKINKASTGSLTLATDSIVSVSSRKVNCLITNLISDMDWICAISEASQRFFLSEILRSKSNQ